MGSFVPVSRQLEPKPTDGHLPANRQPNPPERHPKSPRINSSLLRELWRTAARLEHLPAGARTELGESCCKRHRNNQSTRASEPASSSTDP